MLNKIRVTLVVGLAAVFAASVGLPVATLAHEGEDTSTSDDLGGMRRDDISNHTEELIKKLREQAHARNQAARANAEVHTQEVRQKSCEARKAGLTKRMNNAVRHAEKHKAVFDKIFLRVKQFYLDKNLSADNYDQLVANVDAAHDDLETKISVLKSLNVAVDCTSENIADAVGAFKDSVGDVRDSLKAYRKAIVELIKAVHQSAENSESNDATGGVSDE